MAILTAEYLDVDENSIATTYDDGRPSMTVPKVAGNRHYAEILAQPIIPTPFLDVVGRLNEAKDSAKGIIAGAASQQNALINAADGTYTYNLNPDQILGVGISIASGSGDLDLEDATNTIRTLSVGEQQTVLSNVKTHVTTVQLNRVNEQTAIDGAADVPAIDALLAGSYFGDLSPVYPSV